MQLVNVGGGGRGGIGQEIARKLTLGSLAITRSSAWASVSTGNKDKANALIWRPPLLEGGAWLRRLVLLLLVERIGVLSLAGADDDDGLVLAADEAEAGLGFSVSEGRLVKDLGRGAAGLGTPSNAAAFSAPAFVASRVLGVAPLVVEEGRDTVGRAGTGGGSSLSEPGSTSRAEDNVGRLTSLSEPGSTSRAEDNVGRLTPATRPRPVRPDTFPGPSPRPRPAAEGRAAGSDIMLRPRQN